MNENVMRRWYKLMLLNPYIIYPASKNFFNLHQWKQKSADSFNPAYIILQLPTKVLTATSLRQDKQIQEKVIIIIL